MHDIDTTPLYDIAIIGAGINGCGIARDAAGQGYRTFLCDKGDIGGATSCSSSKLIHGGLRYLETYEFGLVRKALKERERLLKIAPHIMWPMQFILPHSRRLRPLWLLRLGVFLYDLLAPFGAFPKSRRINLHHHVSGTALLDDYTHGIAYSDGWVDDHRLVLSNALDAAQHGATVQPYTACEKAEVIDNIWRISLSNKKVIRAKILINAAGPWAANFASTRTQGAHGKTLRLVQGSHIVVKKMFHHTSAYILQQEDGRIVFALPYENDFTLIGTTDEPYTGDPSKVTCGKAAQTYLCHAVNSYFKQHIRPRDVIWSYAGVRPLIEGDADRASKLSRDYTLDVEKVNGAPMLNIWGGKLTTYRILAEEAMRKISPFLGPVRTWSASAPLPGGDVNVDLHTDYPWLPEDVATRYARSYGSLAHRLLEGATNMDDMGLYFGATLYAREIDYLCAHEWARDADAVLWRRSKQGLHLSPKQRERVARYIAARR